MLRISSGSFSLSTNHELLSIDFAVVVQIDIMEQSRCSLKASGCLQRIGRCEDLREHPYCPRPPAAA